jgi:hypothetical protein
MTTYAVGDLLHTEPGPKGITVWYVEWVEPSVAAWGRRPDGTVWHQEPIENLTVLANLGQE